MADTPPSRFANSGGFIRPSLPSPAPSTVSTRAAASLPHPRSRPLLAGSRKEDYARNYVSRKLMHISRRFVKHHGIPDPADEVTGYESFDEVCKDLEEVIDVLWFSGTPSLQIPYLLNMALSVTEYLPSFSPAPRPTFALLKKLDHCFASLLAGKDIKSGEPLPGIQGKIGGMTRTDMVRCRSMVDDTRRLVAVEMSGEEGVETDLPEDDDLWVEDRTAQSTAHDAERANITGKRKSSSSEDADEATEPAKKIKLQDDDAEASEAENGTAAEMENGRSPMPNLQSTSRAPASGTSNKGQFHWALDEDSDEEEAQGESHQESNTEEVSEPPSQLRHEDEPPDDPIDEPVDEEEEEMHMNVAKVYELTIVQLGKLLGESFVGG